MEYEWLFPFVMIALCVFMGDGGSGAAAGKWQHLRKCNQYHGQDR